LSDLHLDRRIIARAESKHQSLYKDHLAEVDAEGKQVGRDLIPWNWSLDFLAVETLTRTTLDIREPYRFVTERKRRARTTTQSATITTSSLSSFRHSTPTRMAASHDTP